MRQFIAVLVSTGVVAIRGSDHVGAFEVQEEVHRNDTTATPSSLAVCASRVSTLRGASRAHTGICSGSPLPLVMAPTLA
eukprot:1723848-Pleurochrysis_carterae.AAC.1